MTSKNADVENPVAAGGEVFDDEGVPAEAAPDELGPEFKLVLWIMKWSGLDAEASPRPLKVALVAGLVFFAVRHPRTRLMVHSM